MSKVTLRPITEDDLPTFFHYQLDPEANNMAAFTAEDPSDRATFDAHWVRIMSDQSVLNRAILLDGQVAGNIGSFLWEGRREVTYWVAHEHWGNGVATAALMQYLPLVTERPLYAHAAHDNLGSIRVLEKCGFREMGRERGYANARGEEIEEVVLILEKEEKK